MVVPSIAGSRCRHPPRLRRRADLATAPLDGGSGPTTWTPPARRTKEDTPRLRLSTDRPVNSADRKFRCMPTHLLCVSLARRCIEIRGLFHVSSFYFTSTRQCRRCFRYRWRRLLHSLVAAAISPFLLCFNLSAAASHYCTLPAVIATSSTKSSPSSPASP
ncbi:hypothetical protein B296_00049275 [Ensete ventricosum]|uniref:Uncharacterized protein n=1 Tax=Ensete ventricosum TaxID=4639 RepID=A0A426YNN0_ENSVE|nr:hypothetical protein B296_00049275 [Ensete ventricosum]